LDSVFSVPWDVLELEHVKQFLAEGYEEGLRWEAKGGDPRSAAPTRNELRDQIREEVCGFANSIGGVVIFGVERGEAGGARWSLPGMVFPVDEPVRWIDDVIRDSLNPVPRFEPKTWALPDDRTVAAIGVEPVAEPPCMTRAGSIYERVSSKTIRVNEPLVLLRLTERGTAAAEAAISRAQAATRETTAVGSIRSQERLAVSLGIGAVGYEPDISSRLFTEHVAQRFRTAVADNLLPDRGSRSRPLRQHVFQNRIELWSPPDPTGEAEPDRAWLSTALWNGGIGIRCAANDTDISLDLLLEDVLWPSFRVAFEMLELVGGYGRVYLTVALSGGFTLYGGPGWSTDFNSSATAARWVPDSVLPTTDVVESLKREFLRAAGFAAWEPPAIPDTP
jgi:hypothetical protein